MGSAASPTPEQTARTLSERCALQASALERRERAVLALLPEVAAALRAMGARRVFLFGTLAWGGFHERSDVDIAVEGLAPDARADAWIEAERITGEHVDLLLLERLSPSFRERIEREGVLLG